MLANKIMSLKSTLITANTIKKSQPNSQKNGQWIETGKLGKKNHKKIVILHWIRFCMLPSIREVRLNNTIFMYQNADIKMFAIIKPWWVCWEIPYTAVEK